MSEDVFRAQVRQRRQVLGWSQQRVAEEMTKHGHAWHQTTVAKVEAGQRPIGLGEAVALGRVLGANISDMTSEAAHNPEAQLLDLRQRELAILDRRAVELHARLNEATDQEHAAREMAARADMALHAARDLAEGIRRELAEVQTRIAQVHQWLSRSTHPSQPPARRLRSLRSGPE